MKYEIRNTKYQRRAFTLIELIVAIGLLSIVLVFSGVVFQRSIGSYRTASAQAEIMRKLRVITEQLDSDFRGLRKDAPMFIWFHLDPNSSNQRFDQIMFFADGDFQVTNGTIAGNVARIYYGQARSTDPRDNIVKYPIYLQQQHRLLARRQHILTADDGIPVTYRWPDQLNFVNSFDQNDAVASYLFKNDTFEYDWLALSQWQALAIQPANVDKIVDVCFNSPPVIKFDDPNTLHNLMTEGVASLSIQWSYPFSIAGKTFVYWWPSIDPDGNGDFTDSDFSSSYMNLDAFGFYFNASAPSAPLSSTWLSYQGAKGFYYPNPLNPADKPSYPQALKFTFTLYDSKGVFKDGQTFTHIVYLGD